MIRRPGLIKVVMGALVLAVAMVAVPGQTEAQTPPRGDTVDVDVRVWQSVRDPWRIHVSARREGGSYGTLGTVRLLLDDGENAAGTYQFGDVAVDDVVVRVWQHVGNPHSVLVNARPVDGDWNPETRRRLSIRDGRSRDRNFRFGDITITVPTPSPVVAISPGGEEVPRLAGLTVTFREAPETADAAAFVSIEPPIEGAFVWLDGRTLLFQPDYPGWQRGQQYRVVVDAGATGLAEDHVHTFKAEGALRVVYVTPGDGDIEVPANARILVQFSRSVAPLTVLQEGAGPTVLRFDPPVSGRGEWLNTSLYRFFPAGLQPSTTYTVRIPARVAWASGGVLEADYRWSFSTTQPTVTGFEPHDNSNFVEPDANIRVTFSQPMDRASGEAGITLREVGGDLVASSFSWSQDSSSVRLVPDEPLKLSTRYQVAVAEGLRDAWGGRTRAERSARFTTVDPPMVTSTSPADGEQAASTSGISIHYNNPMDRESFKGRISINGATVPEDGFWAWDRSVSIPAGMAYSAEYTVRVAEGVRDRGGRSLPAYEFSFRTRERPPPEPPRPAVSLGTGTFALWPEGGEHRLEYGAQAMDEVRFELYRLSEGEAETLLRRGWIDGRRWVDGVGYKWVRFEPESEAIRAWTEAIPEESRDTWTSYSTSLGGGEPLPIGHYYVLAEGEGDSAASVISVVNTTMVTKLADGELLVWAVDYETGEALAGVKVRAVSAGEGAHEFAGSETTDADGLARFTVPSRSGNWYWNPYGHYLARIDDGERNGVVATWWDEGSSPWALDVPTRPSFPSTKGHLYSDRPIYRPGETVFLKGVVRDEDDASYSLPGADQTYTVTIRDASYEQLPEMTVGLSELGTFAIEVNLRDDAPTGSYWVSLRDDDGFIVSTRFRVSAFRVPEFEVEVEAEGTDFVAGDTIPGETQASFYAGGPVGDAPLDWAALSQPTFFRVEGYEEYSFGEYQWSYRSPRRGSGSTQTDRSGFARFKARAALDEGESTHLFTISATVTDQNGQAVANSTTVTVHPATWYAGIRTESYIATAGKPATVHLVTVDYKGRVAPERPVTVRLFERDWRKGELIETERDMRETVTGEDGEGAVTLTAPSPGSYRIVAESTDEQGRVARSERYLWVTGREYAPWRSRDDHYIELVADRDRYEVGDVAEVLVPAPFGGVIGLVTVERGRVLSSEVRRFETNSEVLRIPIEAGHVPNVYVGVVLYLPPGEENPLPRYRIGYVNLSISTASRELDVRVEPDRDEARPGETVRYEVEVTDSEGQGVEGEVSVAIVDKAVLSLAEDVGPTGLEAFWYERPLGVRTAWSREPAGLAEDGVGGDAEEAMEDADPEPGRIGGGPTASRSRPRVRSDFEHTALWIGQLATDENGRASLELELPDNATTWRAQARAVTAGTRVGEGESELLVTQELLVRPALPRFLRVGDELSVRTLVWNRTDEATNITVAIEAAGVTLDDDGAITKRVEAGRSVLFAWPARALEEGTATIRFTATTSGGHGDAVELSIPVYLDVTAETTATGGVVEDTPRIEAVYLPEYVITDGGSLELSVQGSLVGALDEELHFFTRHPWESNVRIASRIVAMVAVQHGSANGLTEAQERQIAGDIERLVGQQRSDGGWAWCQYCKRTDLWVTGWVLIALGEARDAGYDVPPTRYERTRRLITNFVQRQTDFMRPANVNQHAFLLYALASAANEGGEVSPLAREQADLMGTLLEEHRVRLTSWGRAYLVLGLLASGHEPGHEYVRTLLNDLTASTIASANGNHWEDAAIAGCMHNSGVRATALVLRALTDADPQHPLIEETVRWLVVARSAQWWETSVDRAQAMASLGAFAELTGESRGVYDYQVLLNTQRVLTGDFDVPARDYVDRVTVPLEDLPLGEVSRVQFDREAGAEGRLYYGLNLRYLTPAKHVEALNRGFAVSHRYSLLDQPYQYITSAPVGSVVRVTVTVVAPAERLFAKVEDFLPAGLEPIDPALDIVSEDLLQKLRDDYNRLSGRSHWYWGRYPWRAWPWDQVDVRDDRVVLLADRLPAGVHEYVYYARATTPGDFFVAPVHAQETYFPEVFGRDDSSRFTVTAE
ncbi:MAG: hypothetical protein F4081_06740 [Dehalococcoidia bacterium]|nr:hypothetical protein [Dehalococcoidia bacterium]